MIYYDNRGVIIRDPADADIADLARNMRIADAKEVYAASGLRPTGAIIRSLSMTPAGNKFTVTYNNNVSAVFGCIPCMGHGVPWLLGTEKIDDMWITFARESRRFIKAMLNQHGYLTNYVDTRNTKSIEWLKWCGFTILPAEPHGIFGLPFHRFEQRREGNV